MAAFFIRTDAVASGPFTGIELREAAIAGILRPDSVIAGAPEGPWILASDAGLFSEKRVALPHPPEVSVPQYQVRGMPGAFQGPFKLRELIGFAARGMLPSDALLQSDASEPWVPVERIKILSACLQGELALIDQRGNVIRRAVHPTAQPLSMAAARAPVEVSRSADSRDSTAFASTSEEATVVPSPSSVASKKQAVNVSPVSESQSGWLRVHLQDLRSRVSDLSRINDGMIGRRILFLSLGLVGILILASAVFRWRNLSMQRTQLLGEWIGNSPSRDGGTPFQFGIAFRPDGHCVVFNPTGASWTGDFQWIERIDQAEGLQKIEAFTVSIDTAEPQHSLDIVRSSDGYLRFFGPNDNAPTIDGHRVADAFVRRENQTLLVGYLTTVQYSPGKKQLQAAWIATTLASKAMAGSLGPEARELSVMKPTELLAAFGVPDEARPAYPFEIPSARRDGQDSNAQMLRFMNKKWMLYSDGRMKEIADAKQP